jgi:hypothetical protein
MTAGAETPDTGLVTWSSEGQEGGRFHSRRLHVPTAGSGLTLGRGYDMKCRSVATVIQDLTAAGVTLADATRIAGGAGLSGEDARRFIADAELEDFEIGRAEQRRLFDIAYAAELREVRRICEKKDVASRYGACTWDRLHEAIVELLVDLKFRGDYTPSSRARLQRLVAKNDLEGFARAIALRSAWPGVPNDRFQRRVAFIQEAVKRQRALQARARTRARLIAPEMRTVVAPLP